MFSTEQQGALDKLARYLKETPRETVVAELKEIAKLDFEGVSAAAYFDTFHKHFEMDLEDNANDITSANILVKNQNRAIPKIVFATFLPNSVKSEQINRLQNGSTIKKATPTSDNVLTTHSVLQRPLHASGSL